MLSKYLYYTCDHLRASEITVRAGCLGYYNITRLIRAIITKALHESRTEEYYCYYKKHTRTIPANRHACEIAESL